MKTTITKKGQIVIPAEIRHRHHIQPGQQFEIVDQKNEIKLIPIKTLSLSEAKGWLASSKSAAELIKEARQEEKRKKAG